MSRSPTKSAVAASNAWTRLLVVALIGALGCGRPELPRSVPSPLLGKPVPAIERRALDGANVDTAQLRGRTIVVKFFAHYCEPCKRTLPAAELLSKERPDVVVIGVAEDEDESVVRELVASYGLTFPVIHDRGQVLAGRFRVSDLPVSFVAGPDGRLRWVGGADQGPGDLEQAVEAVAP